MTTSSIEIAGRVLPRARLVSRFWAKVDRSGECWVWTKGCNDKGYGVFGVWHAKSVLAHRVSWIIAHGSIPRGIFVLHHCDNPPCVRPSHLYLGTHEDNARDVVVRKRHAGRSRRTPNARLTFEQAQEIRRRIAAGGISQTRLASEYGVSQSTISLIVLGKVWPEVVAA